MQLQNRLRVGGALVFLALLGMLGTTLLALMDAANAQQRLDEAVAELTTTQTQFSEAYINQVEQQAQSAINDRDELLGNMLTQMSLLVETTQSADTLLENILAQMSSQEKNQWDEATSQLRNDILTQTSPQETSRWDSAVNQLPDLIIEPISIPTFTSDLQSDWTRYLLGAIVSIPVAFAGLYMILGTKPPKKINGHPKRPTQQSESTLRAYKNLFARPIDRIGDLHVWRVQAEDDQKVLRSGIQRMCELEIFLQRYCGITMIGKYGEKVPYNPKLHDSQGSSVPKEALVQIVSPGWKWKNNILRYAGVRKDNGR